MSYPHLVLWPSPSAMYSSIFTGSGDWHVGIFGGRGAIQQNRINVAMAVVQVSRLNVGADSLGLTSTTCPDPQGSGHRWVNLPRGEALPGAWLCGISQKSGTAIHPHFTDEERD